jgi:hypothetical protein
MVNWQLSAEPLQALDQETKRLFASGGAVSVTFVSW